MSDEIIVYQKPTCTTCRQVYAALKESGVDFEAVNYYTDPIPKGKLLDLLRKMKMSARDLLRTREPIYGELGLASRALSDEEIVARAVGGGQRGRHSTEFGILLTAFEDRVVDSFVEPLRSLHHLLCREAVNPHVPLTEMEGEMRERAEGDTTRQAADATVAKPVGDEKREGLFLKILRQVGTRQAGRHDRLAARQPDGEVVIVVMWPERSTL